MLVLAHVSDLHLDGGPRAAERARRVLAYLRDLDHPLDAVLVTGDIADHGEPAEYEQARALLADVPYPVLTCPGNHDRRATFRTELLGEEGEGPVDRAHRLPGALVAMCDSTVPGEDGGLLADETLAWLDEVLPGAADVPAFVCCHHPPVPLHSPFIDRIRQRGEDRLAEVLRRHPQVVAVLCGHAHTAAVSEFAGRPLRVAPGVVSALTLPWEQGDQLDYAAPPALAFHVFDPGAADGRLTTHYRVVS